MTTSTENNFDHKGKHRSWMLAVYDFVPLLAITLFLLLIMPDRTNPLELWQIAFHLASSAVLIYFFRFLLGVYRRIWRFSDVTSYIRLIEADFIAGLIYCLSSIATTGFAPLQFPRKLSIICINLLCCIAMRLVYQFLYQSHSRSSKLGRIFRPIISFLTGLNITPKSDEHSNRIKIAIVGAGRIGSMLADELIANKNAPYIPVCFVDIDNQKVGREIYGIKVISDNDINTDVISRLGIQEFVVALPHTDAGRKNELFEIYKKTGCKIKVYDYPLMSTSQNGRRQLRDFDIEDLLYREAKSFVSQEMINYYTGKTVLISGGGGSIGSELCRQIALMKPKKLVILDVYENGAYDIQQELKEKHGAELNIVVEIATVCVKEHLESIFDLHRPEIVLHAAAHKHVPLMERNCCEAVRNNVFGTYNIVEVSEKYGVEKFTMISTDKAVNPTNIMGATKRLCEMIVKSRGNTKTNFSATRFGNVLGSNGSVIPLFKRQIANGGPVTVTDKRIIRYFMTIPEAAQLVLQSGAMAKNGELYILDMGKPVSILHLAENMITLSGFVPYKDIDIVETGLRPGEKLYEELLVASDNLSRTENELIFIERDVSLDKKEVDEKLNILRQALSTGDNDVVRAAMMEVVPTYHTPEEVNQNAVSSKEMQDSI